jgi:hypothetical protein
MFGRMGATYDPEGETAPMSRCPLVAGWRSAYGRRRGPRLLRSWWCAVVETIAVFVVAAGSASAQVSAVPMPGWTIDGERTTELAVGPSNVLYLAGSFLTLGTRTGT